MGKGKTISAYTDEKTALRVNEAAQQAQGRHAVATAREAFRADVQGLEANRIAFYPSSKGPLLISHPYVLSECFRQGKTILPEGQQFDFLR